MKEEMVHWELILSEVNALYNKIKNASLGPDEIIAMQSRTYTASAIMKKFILFILIISCFGCESASQKTSCDYELFLIRHSDMVSMNTMAHLLRFQHMWQSVTASCSQNLRTPVSIKACKRLPEPLWTIQIQSLIITRRKQTKMRSCFIFHIQIFNRGICSLRYR